MTSIAYASFFLDKYLARDEFVATRDEFVANNVGTSTNVLVTSVAKILSQKDLAR